MFFVNRLHFEPHVKIQTLFVANLYLGQILAGYGLGWSSSSLPKLKDQQQTPLSKDINDMEASWIASIYFVGAIIGPHTITFVSNIAGRKPCLFIGGSITGLSYLILGLAKNLALILVGRLFCGIGIGIMVVMNIVYIGEMASTSIRGIYLTLLGIFNSIGLLIVFSIAPLLSYALLNLLGIVFSVLYLCGILCIPETPLFLVMKGQDEKAEKILQILKREDDLDNIISIKNNIELNTNKWSEIFTVKGNRKALFITLSLHIFEQLSGAFVVLSFATTIFELANSSLNAYISTVLVGATQILAACITPIFVERSGRKSLLLWSTAICFFSIGLLATYFYLDEFETTMAASIKWLPPVAFIAFTMSYTLGLAIIPSTFIGEMFTPSARSIGASISLTTGWLLAFAMTSAFGYLLQLGTHVAFWVFTAACGVTCIFTIIFVPETKGKTLLEVQEMLG